MTPRFADDSRDKKIETIAIARKNSLTLTKAHDNNLSMTPTRHVTGAKRLVIFTAESLCCPCLA